MLKKASNRKAPRKSAQGGSKKNPETKAQIAVRGSTSAAVKALRGDALGAALDVAGTLYELAAAPSAAGGPLRVVQKSAPVTKGYGVVGRSNVAPIIQQSGPDTITVRGRQEVMRLEVQTLNYMAYDLYNNNRIINDTMGGFSIMAKPGSTSAIYGNYGWGYPSFLMPSRLGVLAQCYDFYRFEEMTYTYVPQLSTSHDGSISLAWAPTNADAVDITSNVDIWGSAPNTSMVLSQCPFFSQAPCWQAQAIKVTPRKHGICENPKDYMSVKVNTNSSSHGTAQGGVVADSCGFLHIAMKDFGTPATNYTAGYIVVDYVVTFHVATPTKSLTYIYSVTDFLDAPHNADLKDALHQRYALEKKNYTNSVGGIDFDKALAYRRKVDRDFPRGGATAREPLYREMEELDSVVVPRPRSVTPSALR